jgi:hypothetical protein
MGGAVDEGVLPPDDLLMHNSRLRFVLRLVAQARQQGVMFVLIAPTPNKALETEEMRELLGHDETLRTTIWQCASLRDEWPQDGSHQSAVLVTNDVGVYDRMKEEGRCRCGGRPTHPVRRKARTPWHSEHTRRLLGLSSGYWASQEFDPGEERLRERIGIAPPRPWGGLPPQRDRATEVAWGRHVGTVGGARIVHAIATFYRWHFQGVWGRAGEGLRGAAEGGAGVDLRLCQEVIVIEDDEEDAGDVALPGWSRLAVRGLARLSAALSAASGI